MAYESQDKMVSHPDHYQSKNGMETIDVIEAFTEGLNGIEAACTANILKYACRWKNKNGIQDLEKIIWYTQHLIDHLKAKKIDDLGVTGGVHLPLGSSVNDLTKVPEVDVLKIIKKKQLVKVVHIDYEDKPKLSGSYYFFTYDDLKNGDIVECDTKHGCVLGQVVATEDNMYIDDIILEVGKREIKFCRKRNDA
jgi:DNA-directed RNA polymerase subunit H (RpoH/RPB5)